ncbi:MAG: DUF1648 domain-containing protein [Clostridia bacterium]|nr:DUF1648 domain-containing protein [Clostridia bacterium]
MKNKKNIITYAVLMFIPLIAVVAAICFLPDEIAMHFGLDGKADRFGSKFELFLFPVISIILGVGCFFMAKSASKDENGGHNNENIVMIAGICVLSMIAIITFYTIFLSIENITDLNTPSFQIANILCFVMGAMLIVLGNIMPKAKKNSIVGFRFPWTMKNDEVWAKSQHFAGIAEIISGVFIIAASFFVHNFTAAIVILGSDLVTTIVCFIYAYRLNKNAE